MSNVEHQSRKQEHSTRSSPDEAYSTLQKNYNVLLSEHARAIIAVDQLRVAKYLARPRAFQDKGIGTQIQTQTDDPETPTDMDAAVTELEEQISECVPLFTGNTDPVGDLQVLLQGMQSELAECLRNSDEVSCNLKNRIADCEEKIRNMEGALSLKILDQNNSRGNSRASSRTRNRHGVSLCHTSSLLSGADSSDHNLSAVHSFDNFHNMSHYGTSEFERDEEICAGDSLSDIIDMHNELRAESEVVTEPEVPESVHSGQYVRRTSRRTDGYGRSCSENDSESVSKSGQKHNSDSALGSSVTVNRKSNSIGVQESARTTTRGIQASDSNLSIASCKRMMYCTPLIGSQPPSRASTPAKGYDYKPGPGITSYQNSECGSEVQEIISRGGGGGGGGGARYDHGTCSRGHDTRQLPEDQARDTDGEIARRAPIRAKRTRTFRKEAAATTSGGYDSGYNEEASRKSSPNRAVNSMCSPKSSPRSAQEFRSEISIVRDDVQELADRLRNLRSSMNSSRSSSPVLPPRSHTREALRDRLRRLQCSSPASHDAGTRRSASPEQERYRSSSPQRYNRSSSPSTRYSPRSPVLGYPHSPRSTSPAYRTPRSPRSHSPDLSRNYRDTRHLFYDRPQESYPGKPPIEVGVRIGGPTSSAANFEVAHPQSPRSLYPIENFHVSPTSGMETHFHFNFYGQGNSNGEYAHR